SELLHLDRTHLFQVTRLSQFLGSLGSRLCCPVPTKGMDPVSDLQVIWGTSRSEIVHKFVNGSDDLGEQDPRFKNRTKMFRDQLEQGNWSVLTSDLRESDQNDYQIYESMGLDCDLEQSDLIHLSVTGPGISARGSFGFEIGISAVFVVVFGIGLIKAQKGQTQGPFIVHVAMTHCSPCSDGAPTVGNMGRGFRNSHCSSTYWAKPGTT
ncbi:hypothetical protein chiPu_0017515, partial [Chiloscyllium punctatum]|nr:hypothetical protein [Chiloscyllium punctatum]